MRPQQGEEGQLADEGGLEHGAAGWVPVYFTFPPLYFSKNIRINLSTDLYRFIPEAPQHIVFLVKNNPKLVKIELLLIN